MGTNKAAGLNPNEILGGLRVLFVDESREECELFTVIFEGYGAFVTTAGCCAEALDAFERARPDLLISDLSLPDRDGCELIGAIRSLPPARGGETPAIALSSWSRDHELRRALDSGYARHISKPVDYDDLLCAIAEQRATHAVARAGAPAPRASVVASSDGGSARLPGGRVRVSRSESVDGDARDSGARGAAPVAPAAPAAASHARLGGNTVLESLPEAEREALTQHASLVKLQAGGTLVNVGETWSSVFFPVRSVVSLLSMVESGKTVEVCPVGRRGLAGLAALVGTGVSPHWARVLVGGDAVRVRAADLRALASRLPHFDAVLREVTCARFTELSQTAICNRVHTIDRQLAKWLLLVCDGAQTSTLRLTHETIAHRFGTRRSSISLALEAYQRRGLISASRGRIRILDAAGLREIACECLGTVAAAHARVAQAARGPVAGGGRTAH